MPSATATRPFTVRQLARIHGPVIGGCDATNVNVGKVVGGFDPGEFLSELEDAIAMFDADRFVPEKPRVKGRGH